jgi:hypothetical protein
MAALWALISTLGCGPMLTPQFDVFSNLDVDAIDANMDLDGEVNWYSWVESAKGMD